MRRYHAEEFQNARDNYYTEGDVIRGVWHGQLANGGDSPATCMKRSSIGSPRASIRSPASPWSPPNGSRDEERPRRHVKTMEHRAGWDATFSAPKSVSLTALVGGDDRVAVRRTGRVCALRLASWSHVAGADRTAITAGNDRQRRGRPL